MAPDTDPTTAGLACWQALPKAELHVHLRGAMPMAVFADLLSRRAGDLAERLPERHRTLFERYDNIRPFLRPRAWSAEEVAPLFRFASFDQFLATFAFTGYAIGSADDFQRLVDGVLASFRAQRIVYAEITVSVREYLRRGVPLPALCAILDEAAAAPGIRVRWIVDLVRDFGPEAGLTLLAEIIAQRCASIVGITLGGSEHRHPPAGFAAIYDLARAHGLRLTVHAGEALGPPSVWDALTVLGVERIGHGVRAVEDPALVRHLAERALPLEVCPTSNLATGLYPSLAGHPLRALHDAGVPLSLNSDDPTFFGTTLAEEYARVEAAGLPTGDVLALLKNGFRHAFLPPAEIARYLAEVDAAWAAKP
jgi:adenosine deaminase